MSMLPNFYQQAQNLFQGLIGFFSIFFGTAGVIVFAFGVVSYILESLGAYTIAKRRGIHNSWLAWIPVGRAWLLGAISDQYQRVVKGNDTDRRKLLLWLNVSIVALPAVVGLINLVTFLAAPSGGFLYGTVLAIAFLASMAVTVMRIVAVVFRYIALYDLYQSSQPGNAILYLLFSILLNVTLPFFVFACRDSDEGMPVRQPEPETV